MVLILEISRDLIGRKVSKGKERVVVALDPPLLDASLSSLKNWIMDMVRTLNNIPLGYKLGLPLAILLGFSGLSEIIREIRRYDEEAIIIADYKLADVWHVNETIVKIAGRAGFDAIIAHAFIGWNGGVEVISRTAREEALGVFLVATLSNPGATDVLDKGLKNTINVIAKAKNAGIVAPATRPHLIKMLRETFPDRVIMAPGIGAQGQKPGVALLNGADIEIVGRLITRSASPRETLLNIVGEQKKILRETS